MIGTSPQTKRVLELAAKGIPAAAIAERLGIRRGRVNSIVSEDRARQRKAAEVVE